MKMLKILALCTMLPFFTFAQTAKENGEVFIQKLFEQEFDDAMQYIDESVQGQITPTLLSQTEAALRQQLGDFKSIIEDNYQLEDGHPTWYYYSKFDRASLDIKVVFSEDNKIMGFFLVPHKDFDKKKDVVDSAPQDYSIKSGNILLPGTLLLGEHPNIKKLVIFIHGSGPHDRDETILENKPFKDIAESLLQSGISSYRYDKKTKVAPLFFLNNQYTVEDEVTDDVLAILNHFLQNDTFQQYQIYVLGHSLGATMIPKIAVIAGQKLSGAIMMAGTARSLQQVLLEQIQYLNTIQPSKEMKQLLEETTRQVAYLESSKFQPNSPVDSLPLHLPASYWQSFFDYHPKKDIQTLELPLLILQGEKDYQVTMVDFKEWKLALKGKKNVTFKSYPDLNHLFMKSKGKPSPEDYQIKGHVAKKVLDDLSTWLLKN